MEQAERWKIASGLNILVGLLLIIAPFVLGFWHSTSPTATSILFGVFIAVIAALHVFRMPLASWMAWANVILGIALFFSSRRFMSITATPGARFGRMCSPRWSTRTAWRS
jgi:membrane protein YdbS with pleckstrin-like domain